MGQNEQITPPRLRPRTVCNVREGERFPTNRDYQRPRGYPPNPDSKEREKREEASLAGRARTRDYARSVKGPEPGRSNHRRARERKDGRGDGGGAADGTDDGLKTQWRTLPMRGRRGVNHGKLERAPEGTMKGTLRQNLSELSITPFSLNVPLPFVLCMDLRVHAKPQRVRSASDRRLPKIVARSSQLKITTQPIIGSLTLKGVLGGLRNRADGRKLGRPSWLADAGLLTGPRSEDSNGKGELRWGDEGHRHETGTGLLVCDGDRRLHSIVVASHWKMVVAGEECANRGPEHNPHKYFPDRMM
ncbi:hypothetical protein C8T65DRAFT_700419 [Cerioporus squamosus]|nr:hypothetical protein C8T65DRAFT_700419 [Cerioporus squamosus]